MILDTSAIIFILYLLRKIFIHIFITIKYLHSINLVFGIIINLIKLEEILISNNSKPLQRREFSLIGWIN
jgi:hypothetical protein